MSVNSLAKLIVIYDFGELILCFILIGTIMQYPNSTNFLSIKVKRLKPFIQVFELILKTNVHWLDWWKYYT